MQSGPDLWRGDHVLLLLDFARSGQWEPIIQLGLSPGSLLRGGTPPEAVFWRPEGLGPDGVLVASRKTPDGYELEAAIPWKTLRIEPIAHQVFTFDVALSDSDQTPNQQAKCLSFSTAPWSVRDSSRLVLAGLGDRTGYVPPGVFDARRIDIAQPEFIVAAKGQKKFVVEADAVPEGLIPTLTFRRGRCGRGWVGASPDCTWM